MSQCPKQQARQRAATRERQRRSLRLRRHQRIPTDRHVLRILLRGWLDLDRMEARCVPMSRAEVAASLGLSPEAVRLIEIRALRKVRAALGVSLG